MKSKEIYPQQTIEKAPVLEKEEKSVEDAFKFLGIERSRATLNSIKKIFWEKIKFCHPDKGPKPIEEAKKTIASYKEAIKYLKTQEYKPKLKTFQEAFEQGTIDEKYLEGFSEIVHEACLAWITQNEKNMIESLKKMGCNEVLINENREEGELDFLYLDELTRRITQEANTPKQAGELLLALGFSYHKLGNFVSEEFFLISGVRTGLN